MKYWIRINNSERGPYDASEIVQVFGASLPSNTSCARVGENSWARLGDLLPEIGTATPLPEPPGKEPSPHIEAIANGFIKKIIALPIYLITGLVAVPVFIRYDRTDDLFWGIVFFSVIVLGVSASILVPMYILSKHDSSVGEPLLHSVPFLGSYLRKRSSHSTYSNPFTEKTEPNWIPVTD